MKTNTEEIIFCNVDDIDKCFSNSDKSFANNFVIISGDGPESKYMASAAQTLAKRYGASCVHSLTLPSGEQCKSLDIVKMCWNIFAKFNVDRSSYVVAIGGGSITDTVGFAASTYLRGVKLAFVPTTLTCAIDAAIGGKNAINIAAPNSTTIKNQIGNFYCADKVIIDANCFCTLAPTDIASGLCEIAKTAFISDTDLIEILQELPCDGGDVVTDCHVLKSIIDKCIQFKQSVVQTDPLDTLGKRAILNYGHTLGHAIEAVTDCQIPHGLAVAAGMDFAAFVSEQLNFVSEQLKHSRNNDSNNANNNASNLVDDQRKILSTLGINIQDIFQQLEIITDCNKNDLATQLVKAIESDKKSRDDNIAFITLKSIKKPTISWLSTQQLNNFLIEYKQL